MKKTTHDTSNRMEERAVLVSLIADAEEHYSGEWDYSLQELTRLAETAGVVVLDLMTQRKDAPDPKWLIGKGKVLELKQRINELEANVVIFNQELSGAQVRNLEEMLDAKIIDRTQLILDIFAQRAKTREGILQVELAQLNYLLPRLSGHGKNLSRLGGGIGTRGPGETKLETDRRHIRRRIRDLKAQLGEVMRHRELHRERRRKNGIFQVALVGYTNAGKSTLLHRLTEAQVYIEDQLFATLDPTSRILPLSGGIEALLTDTVGFIQHLPHDLVAAFRSTLEEVCEADLILHVVDASSEFREEQIRVVNEILSDLGAAAKPQLLVYNKNDLLSPEDRALLPEHADVLSISAYNDEDLARVCSAIRNKLVGGTITYRIPADQGDLIALVYRIGEVLDRRMEEEQLIFAVRLNPLAHEKWGGRLEPYALTSTSV
jgi:GTP-binding protein HflX